MFFHNMDEGKNDKTKKNIMFSVFSGCPLCENIQNIMFFFVLSISLFEKHTKHNVFLGFICVLMFFHTMDEEKNGIYPQKNF